MLEYFDTGLLNEGDYMQRAKDNGKSVYETIRSYRKSDYNRILRVAQLSGKISTSNELIPYLKSDDNAVKYWALIAADAYNGDLEPIKFILNDDYSVAIMAAEILVKRYDDPIALQLFKKFLKSDNEPLALQAAISLRRIGDKAAPLLPVIENEIFPIYEGDVWGRYKNWSYPMFIGMALNQTLINCGKEVKVR